MGGDGDDAGKVLSKGYLGAETGIRLNVPTRYGALAFDAAAGIGLVGPIDSISAAGKGRVGGAWRFGNNSPAPTSGWS